MKTLINYVRESWGELQKVKWPSREQTIRLTIAVIIFSVVLAIFMGLIDLGLGEILKRLIL